VWVICDNVQINFPVPYLNNYELWGITEENRKWYRDVLENYHKGITYPTPSLHTTRCPYENCNAVYNLHSVVHKKGNILCPTCLKSIHWEDGWLLEGSTD
jgi:hypothetical protein